jgi:hypothetical protein
MMDQSSSWSQLHQSQFHPPSWQGRTPPLLSAVRNAPKQVGERAEPAEPLAGALVARLDPAKIQEVAASQLVILDGYYQSVLRHTQQLFRWALIEAGFGLLLFLAAVSLQFFHQPVSVSIMSLVGGGVMEGMAALNFLLYWQTFRELEKFHTRLNQTQQYLLANSICEKLDQQFKPTAQAQLVRLIMDTMASDQTKPKSIHQNG